MLLIRFLRTVIRYRTWVYAVSVLVSIIGIMAARRVPIDALPNLSENQVLVYTRWPDHEPEEIYQRITRPVSESLKNIPGLRSVRGSSDVGFSLIYVIFDEHVSLQAARESVQQVIVGSAIKLPDDVQPQTAAEGIATGQIVWYTLRGEDTDPIELRSYQDRVIAPLLRNIPAVAEVASVGGFEPEFAIDIDAEALARFDLDLSEVLQQVQAARIAAGGASLSRSDVPIKSADLYEAAEHLRTHPIQSHNRPVCTLGDIANVSLKTAPRYGSFEQDGNELVAGVVHMQPDADTLTVTDAVLKELHQVQCDLPTGWSCLPCYDRKQLIHGSIRTVVRTLLEAILVTTVCVIVIMRHWRTSLVITLTLPLAVLGSLIGISVLRAAGEQVNANIMSLAGIAVSVGILIDAAVVIVENVSYRLRQEFGSHAIAGDTDQLTAEAAAQTAGPAVMAMIIMILSILPLFALQGIDGQMMRPLLWTKTFTLLSVIILAVTLVPCLARDLVRGRLRTEQESRILRSIIEVYEPVLSLGFRSPAILIAVPSVLGIIASAAAGFPWMLRTVTVAVIGLAWFASRGWTQRIAFSSAALILGLVCHSLVHPIGFALRVPLDEGMIMDMPITLPRTTIRQSTDDLKVRDMLLCRFPEVAMVSGKAGRAETAFDPAPIDMIETMVEFRPETNWPRRRLDRGQAREHAAWILQELSDAELIDTPASPHTLLDPITDAGLPRFDAVQREVCWQAIQLFQAQLGVELTEAIAREVEQRTFTQRGNKPRSADGGPPAMLVSRVPLRMQALLAAQLSANSVQMIIDRMHDSSSVGTSQDKSGVDSTKVTVDEVEQLTTKLREIERSKRTAFTRDLNSRLQQRVGAVWTQIIIDEVFRRVPIIDPALAKKREQASIARYGSGKSTHHAGEHLAMPGTSPLPLIDPHPKYDGIVKSAEARFRRQAWLWAHTQASLTDPSGELDQAVQMPGWANVWTRPIQNRIDMLTTGVNAEVGIRVTGDDLQEVVAVSEHIAEMVRSIPGASGVIADPIRGRDYVRFEIDRAQVIAHGLQEADCRLAVTAATTGVPLRLHLSEDARSACFFPARITLQQATVQSQSHSTTAIDPLLSTSLPLRMATDRSSGSEVVDGLGGQKLFTLGSLGTVRHFDGPSTIKSTDGRLSNYVRLNVVGRSAKDWVSEARRSIAAHEWPDGTQIEWTGQYEHAQRTANHLIWLIPLCVIAIISGLWGALRDVADTLLILLTLPGALIGAVLSQWLLGLPISLSVVIGYINCLGMAAATGLVMLVYLRSAVETEQRAGIASIEQLKRAVIRGAVHRLRPKLLTEAAMVISLLPILWSTGPGADVIRPMAAPVLGGILIADEVIDLLIPALFFQIRRRRWMQAQTLDQRG
ncbi:MAG: efflux RND transporter permease subunit [Pirellulales bacterium]